MLEILTIFIDWNDLSRVKTTIRPAGEDLVIHMEALEEWQRHLISLEAELNAIETIIVDNKN